MCGDFKYICTPISSDEPAHVDWGDFSSRLTDGGVNPGREASTPLCRREEGCRKGTEKERAAEKERKGRREGARDRQRQGDTVTERQRETEREAEIQKAVIGESQAHYFVSSIVSGPETHTYGVLLFLLFSC